MEDFSCFVLCGSLCPAAILAPREASSKGNKYNFRARCVSQMCAKEAREVLGETAGRKTLREVLPASRSQHKLTG